MVSKFLRNLGLLHGVRVFESMLFKIWFRSWLLRTGLVVTVIDDGLNHLKTAFVMRRMRRRRLSVIQIVFYHVQSVLKHVWLHTLFRLVLSIMRLGMMLCFRLDRFIFIVIIGLLVHNLEWVVDFSVDGVLDLCELWFDLMYSLFEFTPVLLIAPLSGHSMRIEMQQSFTFS